MGITEIIGRLLVSVAVGCAAGFCIGRLALRAQLKALFTALKVSLVMALGLIIIGVFTHGLWPYCTLAGISIPGGLLLSCVYCFAVIPRRPFKLSNYKDEFVTEKDRVYNGACEDGRYDLYLPKQESADGTYALVLYIHGGGFTGGNKSEGKTWCSYMAAHGYVAASMEYTVHNKEHASNLHRMVEQIELCVSALKVQCAERGMELTEMAVSGVSAGGCLAALYAYGAAKTYPLPVRFLFEQTGPMYFDPKCWNKEGSAEEQATFVALLTGEPVTAEMVTSNAHAALYEAISPCCFVNENSVPTLCAYGPKDGVVPPELKFKLLTALDQNHVAYDYIEYPNSNHGMYSDPEEHRLFVDKIMEYCKTYFDHKPQEPKNRK